MEASQVQHAPQQTPQSRVGKVPITVPGGVEVKLDGQRVSIKGPKGTLTRVLPDEVEIKLDGSVLRVAPQEGSGRIGKQFQGMARALLAGMLEGAAKGYATSLDLVGVGYRAEVKGQVLTLALGLSHQVVFKLPDEIQARVETIDEAGIKKPRLHLTSYDKIARPDRSAHPFVPAARTVQGQRRSLHRRTHPRKSRQGWRRQGRRQGLQGSEEVSGSRRVTSYQEALRIMARGKLEGREKRRARIRKTVSRTVARPRMTVFRSNKQIYCQVIDDRTGKTLVCASSVGLERAAEANKTAVADLVGQAVAGACIQKGIAQVVFDRSGYMYHGRVKALADGARKGGLNF